MRIEEAEEGGKIVVSGIPDATAGLLAQRGLLWGDDCYGGGPWESRAWLLPALVREDPRGLEVPPDVARRLRSAHAALRTPRPSGGPELDRRADESLVARQYQRDAVAWLLATPGAVLADDVGLGKTIVTGTALAHLAEAGGKSVVSAPLSVKFQWLSEAIKVGGRDLAVVAHGTPKERSRAYAAWRGASGGKVLVVHHEVLRRDVAEVCAGDLAALVVDDASVMRSADSSTLAAATAVGERARRRWALTATPVENGLGDVRTVVEWARPGYLAPAEAFDARYVRAIEYSPRGKPWLRLRKVVKHLNVAEARLMLRPVYLRRTREEVGLELPQVIPIVVDLEMEARQRAAYARVVAETTREVKPKDPQAVAMTLREICNDPATAGLRGGSPKLDEIERLAALWPSEKILVATQFRKFAIRIAQRLRRWKPVLLHGGVDARERDHAVRSFTETAKTRILVMTTAGERGLNLQASGILVNADLPWNPAALRQRIGRVYRLGTPHAAIRIVSLVMRGTIEEKVLRALGGKQRLFDSVLDAKDAVGDAIHATTGGEGADDARTAARALTLL